jgi:hypothetical protein
MTEVSKGRKQKEKGRSKVGRRAKVMLQREHTLTSLCLEFEHRYGAVGNFVGNELE